MKKTTSRLLAMLLSFAVVVTFMPAFTQTADAASKQKVQLVSQAKSNNGDTVKYTYNKKGLVTKKVSTITEKSAEEVSVITDTTTYKYNKKNRITKATATEVTKTTYYKTDHTTGLKRTANQGTVTTTDKSVTKYTYKKGVASKAVTTSTTVKSGSFTTTSKYRVIDEASEVGGQYLAGYNYRNPDGTEIEKNTRANAYYYTGAVASAVGTRTTTTTYKDNGNGTYSVVTKTVDSDPNYDEEYVYSYFRKDFATGKFVACTEEEYNNAPDEYYTYYGEWPDDYDDIRFRRTNSVNITITAGGAQDVDSNTDEDVVQNKTVTTTKYTYDKKKRVKKAVSTSVSTNKNTGKYSYTNTNVSAGNVGEEDEYTRTSTDTGSSTSASSSQNTYSWTEKYTYDKKGRVKKITYADTGVANSRSTSTEGFDTYSYESTTTYKNGRVDTDKETTTYPGATGNKTTTSVVESGNKRVTTTSTVKYSQKRDEVEVINGETYNYSNTTEYPAESTTKTKALKAEPETATTTYSYDKQGNMKSAKRSGKNTDVVNVYNETLGTPMYEFDADGELQNIETTVQHTTVTKRTKENTVKDGTNRLSKALTMRTYKSDGYATPGYSLSGRVLYKMKAKSLSKKAAAVAEQQQWIMQNGYLNGIIGL